MAQSATRPKVRTNSHMATSCFLWRGKRVRVFRCRCSNLSSRRRAAATDEIDDELDGAPRMCRLRLAGHESVRHAVEEFQSRAAAGGAPRGGELRRHVG